jgi:hypothetical protein
MGNRLRSYYPFIGIAAFIVALNVLFSFYGPDEIVRAIGITNTYFIAFGAAAIGGLSTLTGVVVFTLIVSFAAGGSTPWLLGIFGGLGIFVSDSVFFWLAKVGRESIPEQWEKKLSRLQRWMGDRPQWLVVIAVYLYLGFAPLPNDLLMIALVLGGYRYRTIFPVIFAGSLTIAMVTAYAGRIVFPL